VPFSQFEAKGGVSAIIFVGGVTVDHRRGSISAHARVRRSFASLLTIKINHDGCRMKLLLARQC
jgi:hypothetical protein